jgi:glycosyltransferase involved in cell wall biosynthesis
MIPYQQYFPDFPVEWQVPDFTVQDLAEKTSDTAIIIPIINEGGRIRRQLSGMATANLGGDIIIADGGSNDGSTDPEGLRSNKVQSLLTKIGPGKLSAQLRMGFAYVLLRGYRHIVTIDGNGKDGFEAIPAFVEALKQGHGFVQGSRYLQGGEAVNTPMDRELAVRLIHAPVLSLGSGFWYTDTTNGFRAFSADFLRDPRVQPFRDVFDTYNLHFYLSRRAARLGYKICELPVRRAYPEQGKTPTKISGFAGRWLILRQLGLTVIGAYDPPTP